MDIACPSCAAMYRVPDALIDGANALRCVACGHAWVPAPAPALSPPPPVTAAPEVPAPPAEAPSPEPAPEPPPLPVAPPPPLPVPPPLPADDAAPVDPPPPVEPGPARPTSPPMRSDVTLSLTATRAGPPGLARRRLGDGPRHRSPGGRMLSLAWIVSIALVITLVLGLVVYGSELAAAWPPFARLVG